MSKSFKITTLVFAFLLTAAFPLLGAMNAGNTEENMNGMNKSEMMNQNEMNQNDVVNTVTTDENFATFSLLLNKSGLAGTLKGEGPFTIFAPNDEAFDALGSQKLEDLMMPKNSEELKSILLDHVVPQKLTDINKEMKVKTLSGKELTITVNNGEIMVNGAKVVGPAMKASNGVVYQIDKVLMTEKSE